MWYRCVALVTRQNSQYNMLVMPKLHFDSFSYSLFVSLLSKFVVVAIMALSISALSLLPPRLGGAATSAQAQVTTDVTINSLDSGTACTSDAQCGGKSRCISGTCQATQATLSSGKANSKTLDGYVKAVEEADKTGKANVADLAGENVLPAIANSITCGIAGCLDDGVSLSLVPAMSSMIGYMFANPAANSYIAFTDILNNAGIPLSQPAYAQGLGGLGFSALNPILEAWKTFRNVAFLFFVILILVIGFMIMFRQKVGQAAVTAQQAIPRIIIALITVTFSYAIAGLLIDAMYVLMALMVGVFGLSGNTAILGTNPITFGWLMVTTGATQGFVAVQDMINAIAPDTFNVGAGWLAGWTVGLVVAIAIAFAIFRLFFELLKTYVTIIISITLSPLLLMFGAIPGRDVFGGWVKSLIGNLAAFPTVLLILLIYDQLTGGISGTRDVIQGGGFAPPYLFGAIAPGGTAQFFIGLGLLLLMTDLVKEAKKALGATGGVFDQFGTAFGDALKKGWTGGELVPGLGFTDTRKVGLSGENLVSKLFRGTEASRKIAEENKGRRADSMLLRRGIFGEIPYQWRRRQQLQSQRNTEQASFETPKSDHRILRPEDQTGAGSARTPRPIPGSDKLAE